MTTARDRPPEEAQEDTSFARGLRVLLTIADRGELRADELSALLDTPISTIYRYLRTLAGFGFVDRDGAGYRLGPRLIIGQGTNVTAEELRRTSEPVLRLLADETGETALIVRRVGLTAVCLAEAPSRHPLRVAFGAGTPLPLDRGAFGTALLAFAPPELVDEVLTTETAIDDDGADETARGAAGTTMVAAAAGATRGPRHTQRDAPLTPDPAAEASLRERLADVVATGIAGSMGEVVPDSVALAVPVFRAEGIVAAIGVIGPAGRCGPVWRRRIERLLPAAASSLVGALGRSQSG
jgi:DNA-binding IclR family transcriptional regulator